MIKVSGRTSVQIDDNQMKLVTEAYLFSMFNVSAETISVNENGMLVTHRHYHATAPRLEVRKATEADIAIIKILQVLGSKYV